MKKMSYVKAIEDGLRFVWHGYEDVLAKEVAKVNRKAAKLGLEGVTLSFGPRAGLTLGVKRVLDHVVYRDATEYTMTGDVVVLNGWMFVAKIEFVEGTDRVFIDRDPFVDPELEIPVSFRTRTPKECDHCGQKRNRRKAYIVRHESGEWKLVGSSCLTDFCAGHNPEAFALALRRLLSMIGDFSDSEFEGMGGHSAPVIFELSDVLDAAIRSIRINGWVPRGQADHNSCCTADDVTYYLNAPSSKDAEAFQDWKAYVAKLNEVEVDPEKVKSIIDWIPTLGSSDYAYNAQTLAEIGMVDRKRVGLAVSLVATFDKAEARKIADRNKPGYSVNEQTSQYVGDKKERREFIVTLQRTIGVDSQYGRSVLHIFADENGNALSWFNSGTDSEMNSGKTYRIIGTIKNHDSYRGVRTTYLNRVSMLSEVNLETVGAA